MSAFSLRARAGGDRAPAGRPVRAARPRADGAELPAVALLGHGRGADRRRSRAISARSAPAPRSRASPQPRASASRPRREADFQLLRYAEHLLASAIGAASSRLVLSLLLRKRTCRPRPRSSCSTTPMRRSSTTAKSCRPRSTTCARASRCSTRICSWSAGTGSSARSSTCRRELMRVGIGLDEILRFNAERGAFGPGEVDDAGAPSGCDALRRRRRAVPRALPRPRPGDRGARQPHAGRRHRHDLHRHHAERRGRRGAGARQRDAGAARARAHRGARRASTPSSPRAKAEADEANISKTRFLAAASHDILQPLNAARLYVTSLVERAGRRRGRPGSSATSTPRSKRSRKSSARCSTSRGSTPAR